MKLQSHSNKLETNVENETQEFGIGDASVVIEILRNRLYQHKVRTLVQEYISNARDAMREVGKGNTFDVTVPTHLNPVFKVRDFGPGISPDRMANIFVKYGSSTKRGSNNQTGGFGIGAKSAWSYTDSFTVVSVVDGVKRSYVAHTGVNNQGRLDLISTEKTDESNGTEIQVAVKPNDISEFRESIFRAIYFWDEKPNLLGELDPPTLVSGDKIGNNIEVINVKMLPSYVSGDGYHSGGQPLAVIDGIPYPIDEDLLEKCNKLKKANKLVKDKLILHFGNGLVEVSASRESIADSDATVKALERIGAKAVLEIRTYIKDKFSSATTPGEFFRAYLHLSKSFEPDRLAKFGEYSIEQCAYDNKVTSPSLRKLRITFAHKTGRYGRKVDKITKEELSESQSGIRLDLLEHTFFLNGTESAIKKNRRINQYLSTQNKMLLIETVVPEDKASLDKIAQELDLKELQTIVLPEVVKEVKAKVARDKSEFCMHVLDEYNRHQYTTLADNQSEWLYIEMDGVSWPEFTTDQLTELNDFTKKNFGKRICGVSPKTLALVEGDSKFSSLNDWLKAWKPSDKNVTYVKCMKRNNKDTYDIISYAKDIKDPLVSEMMKEYAKFEGDRYIKVPEILYNRTATLDEVKEFEKKDKEFETVMKERYPLVAFINAYRMGNKEVNKEITFYMNAKFESKE